MKMVGMNPRRGEGGGEPACYVAPDLSYDLDLEAERILVVRMARVINGIEKVKN